MNRTLKILIWTGAFLLMAAAVYFAVSRQEKVPCKKITITLDSSSSDYPLMTREDIAEIIGEKKLIGTPAEDISANELEKKLCKNPWIKNADVYSYMSGEYFVNVKLRKPILRIIPYNNLGYYLDQEGSMMPLSSHYAAKVPVASGNIFTNFIPSFRVPSFEADSMNLRCMASQLYILARYIDSSKFWKEQIVQIFVNTRDEIELIPRVGNHTIILGTVEDLDDKFRRLFVFYKKGLSLVGWEKYSVLNLSYKNQIVCTKKMISL